MQWLCIVWKGWNCESMVGCILSYYTYLGARTLKHPNGVWDFLKEDASTLFSLKHFIYHPVQMSIIELPSAATQSSFEFQKPTSIPTTAWLHPSLSFSPPLSSFLSK